MDPFMFVEGETKSSPTIPVEASTIPYVGRDNNHQLYYYYYILGLKQVKTKQKF